MNSNTVQYLFQQAEYPPSMGNIAQLIIALWSLNKKRIGFTTSDTSANFRKISFILSFVAIAYKVEILACFKDWKSHRVGIRNAEFPNLNRH